MADTTFSWDKSTVMDTKPVLRVSCLEAVGFNRWRSMTNSSRGINPTAMNTKPVLRVSRLKAVGFNRWRTMANSSRGINPTAMNTKPVLRVSRLKAVSFNRWLSILQFSQIQLRVSHFYDALFGFEYTEQLLGFHYFGWLLQHIHLANKEFRLNHFHC
jgi:hypothetical protein